VRAIFGGGTDKRNKRIRGRKKRIIENIMDVIIREEGAQNIRENGIALTHPMFSTHYRLVTK
jgi:hypothetical protein